MQPCTDKRITAFVIRHASGVRQPVHNGHLHNVLEPNGIHESVNVAKLAKHLRLIQEREIVVSRRELADVGNAFRVEKRRRRFVRNRSRQAVNMLESKVNRPLIALPVNACRLTHHERRNVYIVIYKRRCAVFRVLDFVGNRIVASLYKKPRVIRPAYIKIFDTLFRSPFSKSQMLAIVGRVQGRKRYPVLRLALDSVHVCGLRKRVATMRDNRARVFGKVQQIGNRTTREGNFFACARGRAVNLESTRQRRESNRHAREVTIQCRFKNRCRVAVRSDRRKVKARKGNFRFVDRDCQRARRDRLNLGKRAAILRSTKPSADRRVYAPPKHQFARF